MKSFKILTLAFVLLSFQFLTILGCTKKSGSESETIVVALSAGPNTLDPRYSTDAVGQRINSLLFSSLVRVGPDLQVVPDAAEKWEYKDLVYSFYLRPNITFSNGTPLKPEDIHFTFSTYMSDKSPFKVALKDIESVNVEEKEGRLIVQLKLKQFSATILSDLTPIKLLPKASVETMGEDFGKALIGTGNFKLASQNSTEIVLQARSEHAWAAPKIKQLLFKIIRDDNTRYLRTIKGDLDVVQSEMPLNKVKDFESKEDFSVYKYPGLSMTYLLVNLKDPVLSNHEVRKALAMAINRAEIIQYKLEGLAQEATSILTPQNPFHDAALKNLPYDLAQAKKIIEKHGLMGKELTLKCSNNPAAVENAKVLTQQLSQIGLKVNLQSFEWGTFYGDVQSGNFQIASLRWVGAIDPDIYRMAFHSQETPPGRNRGFYKNRALDELLERGLHMDNEAQRRKHYQKVQEIVLQDLPMIPLWYDQQVSVVHKRVKGYKVPLNGDYSGLAFVSKE